MNRARFAVAALVTVTFISGAALAQQAPPMKSVLAGKKVSPPVRGQADIEYTKPAAKREKELVISTFWVKNVSSGPIARLTVNETWYDDNGAVVTGGRGVINLLQAGEVQEMRVESGVNSKMKTNTWAFAHANGGIKPTLIEKEKMQGIPAEALAPAKGPAKK